MTKRKVGRPEFEPTDDERKLVETMTVGGVTQEQIAFCVRDGIAVETLLKHFGDIMRVARAKAYAKLGANIYQRALNGDGPMSKLYANTQMGWKDQPEGAGANVTINVDSKGASVL